MNYCHEIRAAMHEGYALEQQLKADKDNRSLRRQLRQLLDHEDQLRQQAAKEFATLNGWILTTRDFAPTMLARASTQRRRGEHGNEGWRYELFDHPVYFREPHRPFRPAAIVGQPYGPPSQDAAPAYIERTRNLALQLGLDVHVPHHHRASWWNPPSTLFLCYTRPGRPVAFLPEQTEGFQGFEGFP